MKPLTSDQIKTFVRLVDCTREKEFDCSECQDHVGQFAESQLAGLPMDEAMALVEHHLSLCPDCREEFLILQDILRAGG